LPEGRWEGELSSSALATAVASFALQLAGRTAPAARGFQWLEKHRNEDGGWGDSDRSPSNLSTTLLVWSALTAAGTECTDARTGAETWLRDRCGDLTAPLIADAVHLCEVDGSHS